MIRINYFLISCILIAMTSLAQQSSEWTVMVYLNADNNLESFGIKDFIEMSRVSKSKEINILVQMDRTPEGTTVYGDWTETLRFKIEPGLEPTKRNALQNMGELNMGDPKILIDFVSWSMTNYPAKKYLLIFWDHGDGWRFNAQKEVSNDIVLAFRKDIKEDMLADINFKKELLNEKDDYIKKAVAHLVNNENELLNAMMNKSISTNDVGIIANLNSISTENLEFAYQQLVDKKKDYGVRLPLDLYSNYKDITTDFGVLLKNNYEFSHLESEIKNEMKIYEEITDEFLFSLISTKEITVNKSVSNDDTNGDVLYNKEIEDSLNNWKLDIVGFDACLMSMLEVSYALVGKADYIVGSEELEPGAGWQYDFWLSDLVKNPFMTPRQLSASIVNNYEKAYVHSDNVTLSSIDSKHISQLTKRLDDLALLLMGNFSSEYDNIERARSLCNKYAAYETSIHSIDLYLFVYHLYKLSKNTSISRVLEDIIDLIKVSVVENFHSRDMGFDEKYPSHGSFGIGIYFPKREVYFDQAYTDQNSYFPVSFVRNSNWDNFLQKYYKNKP